MIPEPSISSNSSLWNQLAPEFILIKSNLSLFCWYGCLTDTHTIGYSISGVIIILKTFRGDGRTQSKCFRSINLFNGSYHCIKNIPAGIAPHKYLYLYIRKNAFVKFYRIDTMNLKKNVINHWTLDLFEQGIPNISQFLYALISSKSILQKKKYVFLRSPIIRVSPNATLSTSLRIRHFSSESKFPRDQSLWYFVHVQRKPMGLLA